MGEKQSHFEELLLPHLDGAYNLARWLIETDQDAQAIVHEAYLQVLREFTNFREADARLQLLTIVRNRAHSWIRTPERRSKIISFDEAFLGEHSVTVRQSRKLADGSSAAEAMADRSDQQGSEVSDQGTKRALYEALSKLSVEFREILLLHDIEGWTHTQLASVLEISRAMVLSRLRAARQSLRQELGKAHRDRVK